MMNQDANKVSWMSRQWKEWRGLLLFLILMTLFRSALADWNVVPTGSMKPTIVEGDRILVNKMAYDLRLPFSHISVFKKADPKRGDIIVFDSSVSEVRLVKRVVGVPGDSITMRDNVLTINGTTLNYNTLRTLPIVEDKSEDLFGVKHAVRIRKSGSRASSFSEIVIPDKFYLVLGDNRDNSRDSRFIGLIPRHEIVGRTSSVVLSLNYDNYYLPRSERFFKAL